MCESSVRRRDQRSERCWLGGWEKIWWLWERLYVEQCRSGPACERLVRMSYRLSCSHWCDLHYWFWHSGWRILVIGVVVLGGRRTVAIIRIVVLLVPTSMPTTPSCFLTWIYNAELTDSPCWPDFDIFFLVRCVLVQDERALSSIVEPRNGYILMLDRCHFVPFAECGSTAS